MQLDAWIYHHIEDVHNEDHGHEDGGVEYRDAHDGRIIPVGYVLSVTLLVLYLL